MLQRQGHLDLTELSKRNLTVELRQVEEGDNSGYSVGTQSNATIGGATHSSAHWRKVQFEQGQGNAHAQAHAVSAIGDCTEHDVGCLWCVSQQQWRFSDQRGDVDGRRSKFEGEGAQPGCHHCQRACFDSSAGTLRLQSPLQTIVGHGYRFASLLSASRMFIAHATFSTYSDRYLQGRVQSAGSGKGLMSLVVVGDS